MNDAETKSPPPGSDPPWEVVVAYVYVRFFVTGFGLEPSQVQVGVIDGQVQVGVSWESDGKTCVQPFTLGDAEISKDEFYRAWQRLLEQPMSSAELTKAFFEWSSPRAIARIIQVLEEREVPMPRFEEVMTAFRKGAN